MFLPTMKYLVFQLERGQNGTPHFQGYVYFRSVRTMRAAKALISVRAHMEAARGSPASNKVYCTKAEGRLSGPFEYGSLPAKGKRMDLLEIKQMIEEGVTVQKIARENKFFPTCARHYKFFNWYRLSVLDKRDWPMEVIILFGDARSGKSKMANTYKPAYWKSMTDQYFDDYKGEETIILDDFKPGSLRLTTLLNMMDRYPMQLNSKFGKYQMVSKRIIITSNYEPKLWYPKVFNANEERLKALWGRFTKVIKFTKGQPTIVLRADGKDIEQTSVVVAPTVSDDLSTQFNEEKRRQALLRERLMVDLKDSLDSQINSVNMDELSIDLLSSKITPPSSW